MKNKKSFFDSLGWFLVILLICSYLPTKAAKRKGGRLILCLAVLGFIGYVTYTMLLPQEDCVPLTVQRVFPQYSIPQLRKIFHTDRFTGTYYTNLLSGWDTISSNKLVLCYSADTNAEFDETVQLKFNRPYLWLGMGQGEGHCALAWFSPTNVILSTSQFYPGTTNYYKETIDYTNFFQRTYDVLTSKDLEDENIRM